MFNVQYLSHTHTPTRHGIHTTDENHITTARTAVRTAAHWSLRKAFYLHTPQVHIFLIQFRGSRLILPVPLPQPACLSHSLSKASCRCSAPACDTRPAVPLIQPNDQAWLHGVACRCLVRRFDPVRSGGQSASVRRRRRTPSILAQPVTLGLGGSPCDRGYARTAPLPPPHRAPDDRDASVASSRHSAVLCPSRGAATQNLP